MTNSHGSLRNLIQLKEQQSTQRLNSKKAGAAGVLGLSGSANRNANLYIGDIMQDEMNQVKAGDDQLEGSAERNALKSQLQRQEGDHNEGKPVTLALEDEKTQVKDANWN